MASAEIGVGEGLDHASPVSHGNRSLAFNISTVGLNYRGSNMISF